MKRPQAKLLLGGVLLAGFVAAAIFSSSAPDGSREALASELKPGIVVDPALGNLWLCETADPVCDNKADGYGEVNFNLKLTGPITGLDPKCIGFPNFLPPEQCEPQAIGSFEFEVRYDAKLVSVTVERGSLFDRPDVNCTTTPGQGFVQFRCNLKGKPEDAPSGPGNLAVLRVRATPDVGPLLALGELDEIATQLINQDCNLSDLQGHPIKLGLNSCADADVIIRPYLVRELPETSLWLCSIPGAPSCTNETIAVEEVNFHVDLNNPVTSLNPKCTGFPNYQDPADCDAQTIGFFEFEVRFDAKLVSVTVERGSLFDRPEVNCTTTPGQGFVQFRCVTKGKPVDAPSGPGTLAVVSVSAIDGARSMLAADPLSDIRTPLIRQECHLSDLQGHTIDVNDKDLCQDTTIIIQLLPPPVGGISVDPELAALPAETRGWSGSNVRALAVIAAAISVGAVALGGAAWYRRRRWPSSR